MSNSYSIIACFSVAFAACLAKAECWIDERDGNSGVSGIWKDAVAYSGGRARVEDGNVFVPLQQAANPVSTIFATISFSWPTADDSADGDMAAVRLGFNANGNLQFQLLAGYAERPRWVGVSAAQVVPEVDADYTFRFVLDCRDGVNTYSASVLGPSGYAQLATTDGICDFPLAYAGNTLKSVAISGDGNVTSILAESAALGDDGFSVGWGTSLVKMWGEGAPTVSELASIKAWVAENALSRAGINSELGAAAYLLNMESVPSEMPTLVVTNMEKSGDEWLITVEARASARLDAGHVPLSGTNGRLAVKTSDSLSSDPQWQLRPYSASDVSFQGDGSAVVKVTADESSKFIRALIVR